MLGDAGLCEVGILLQCKFLLLISLLGKIRVTGIGFTSGACRMESCPHHLGCGMPTGHQKIPLREPSELEREEEEKKKTISYPLQSDHWSFLPYQPLFLEGEPGRSLLRGFTDTGFSKVGQAAAHR